MDLASSLKQHFGFDGFREGQREVIDLLLKGHSSLAIFPTGSGKSLCYQLAALHLPHLTLVVSPLLALMQDQVAFLKSKGIAAASIDSSQSFAESQQVMQDAQSGSCKILMVSVERFKNERFRQFIESAKISMLVIDEAHCISEWGHNFRPDYLKIPAYQQQLSIPLVLLLTATATKEVKGDMASRFNIENSHIVQTGFYRNNLNIIVNPSDAEQRNSALLAEIQQSKGASIVYVTLQKTADEVAGYLNAEGVNAMSYHAGMDTEKRERIQRSFMSGEVDVIVATIAFGMGIDKADIRSVIHYDLPKSIENYSQEIGRAGRDGKHSRCITLAGFDGVVTLENFVYGDTPEVQSVEKVLNTIRNDQTEGVWETQLTALSNATNVRLLPLKTLLVQLELKGLLTPKFSYYAEFKFRFIQAPEDILNQFDQARRTFLTSIFEHSPVKRVWATLHMDGLMEQQPTERSRVVAALDYLAEKQMIELQSKQNTEVFAVDENGIQSPALAKELSDYFAEKEQKDIHRIDSMVNFFQSKACLHHLLASYFDDQLAPTHCGHCSTCSGQVAKFPENAHRATIDPATLKLTQASLNNKLMTKYGTSASLDLCCRFLTAITSPYLTGIRARTMDNYGLYENMPYADVRQVMQSLWVE